MALVEQLRRPAGGLPKAGTARRRTLACLTLAMGFVLTRPLWLAAEPLFKLRFDPLKAFSNRAARQSALRSIPFDKLDPQSRAKVTSVLSDVSFFRRMPVQVIQCDPDLYLFLVEHPDVEVWFIPDTW